MVKDSTKKKYLMNSQKYAKTYDRAVELQKKNPAFYYAMKGLRQGLSLRDTVKYVKKHRPKARISATNVGEWKKECGMMIKNKQLFSDFLAVSNISWEQNKKVVDKDAGQRWKEKNIIEKKRDQAKFDKEMREANQILKQMANPNISESELFRLSNSGRRQVDKINKHVNEEGIPMKPDGVMELYDINGKLLAKGKKIILDNLDILDVKSYKDIKALSDILDTAFKQNRLINGESTENVNVNIQNIYDQIIETADIIQDAEIIEDNKKSK